MTVWARVLAVLAVWLLLGAAAGQAKDRKVYFFGNSLIHHLSDTDETTVPHWLAKMAAAAGHRFAADGQWGFLRDFAQTDIPLANWSFRGVKSGWNRSRTAFAGAGWDAIVVNPANFIQYQRPNALSDLIHGERKLVVLLFEHQMQRIEHGPFDVPVIVVRLEIKRVAVCKHARKAIGDGPPVCFRNPDVDDVGWFDRGHVDSSPFHQRQQSQGGGYCLQSFQTN